MLMSQMCVDITFFPLGKLIVRGLTATRLFVTLTPSMIKIDVTPVSAIARLAEMVIAFKYWGDGLPHKCRAFAAIDGCVC